VKIASVFGKDNIFFDSWSIKPGDGIIEKMNSGLENATHFFFFMSANSLTSEMVKLEWQNALFMKTKKRLHFVPVKVDDCNVPAILLQNLYIDIYGKGLDVGIRQIIEVITGNESSVQIGSGFQNVRAEIRFENDNKKLSIKIFVKSIFEPIARFLILHGNTTDKVTFKLLSDSVNIGGPINDLKLNNGTTHNGYKVGLTRGISPGFPVRLELISDNPIDFHGILRAVSEDEYKGIPVEKI
jgi:hypothetical protein